MPVIRISDYVKRVLSDRRVKGEESYNEVLTKLINESKVYIVDKQMIEVVNDGCVTVTIKSRGNNIREKTIQD